MWNTISQRGVAYACLSTDTLKKRLNISNRNKHSRSYMINKLLVNDFGDDVVTKFNNMSRVIQDYNTIITKSKIQKKPL